MTTTGRLDVKALSEVTLADLALLPSRIEGLEKKVNDAFKILESNQELFGRLLRVVEQNQKTINENRDAIAELSAKVDKGMKALTDKFDRDFKELAEDLDKYLPDSQ